MSIPESIDYVKFATEQENANELKMLSDGNSSLILRKVPIASLLILNIQATAIFCLIKGDRLFRFQCAKWFSTSCTINHIPV